MMSASYLHGEECQEGDICEGFSDRPMAGDNDVKRLKTSTEMILYEITTSLTSNQKGLHPPDVIAVLAAVPGKSVEQ